MRAFGSEFLLVATDAAAAGPAATRAREETDRPGCAGRLAFPVVSRGCFDQPMKSHESLLQSHSFEGVAVVKVPVVANNPAVLERNYVCVLPCERDATGLPAGVDVIEHDKALAEVDEFDWLKTRISPPELSRRREPLAVTGIT